jgi:hypothetical protein
MDRATVVEPAAPSGRRGGDDDGPALDRHADRVVGQEHRIAARRRDRGLARAGGAERDGNGPSLATSGDEERRGGTRAGASRADLGARDERLDESGDVRLIEHAVRHEIAERIAGADARDERDDVGEVERAVAVHVRGVLGEHRLGPRENLAVRDRVDEADAHERVRGRRLEFDDERARVEHARHDPPADRLDAADRVERAIEGDLEPDDDAVEHAGLDGRGAGEGERTRLGIDGERPGGADDLWAGRRGRCGEQRGREHGRGDGRDGGAGGALSHVSHLLTRTGLPRSGWCGRRW